MTSKLLRVGQNLCPTLMKDLVCHYYTKKTTAQLVPQKILSLVIPNPSHHKKREKGATCVLRYISGESTKQRNEKNNKVSLTNGVCTSAPVYGETVETRGQSVLNEMDVCTYSSSSSSSMLQQQQQQFFVQLAVG